MSRFRQFGDEAALVGFLGRRNVSWLDGWMSGKKVGRREDLLNIEVSGLGRIRQRESGVGFSLLVEKILQDRFGIDPDEFLPQDAIQQLLSPSLGEEGGCGRIETRSINCFVAFNEARRTTKRRSGL